MLSTVAGRVVLQEAGDALESASISVYEAVGGFDTPATWVRLGSHLTDATGRFHIDFTRESATERRAAPQLSIVVRGRVQRLSAKSPTEGALAVVELPDAAPRESVLIEVPEADAVEAGIVVTGSEVDLQRQEKRAKRAAATRDYYRKRSDAHLKQRIETAVERDDVAASRLDTFLDRWSARDPGNLEADAGDRFVARGDNVGPSLRNVMNRNIAVTINETALTGQLSVDTSKLDQEQLNGPNAFSVLTSAIRHPLFMTPIGKAQALANLCVPQDISLPCDDEEHDLPPPEASDQDPDPELPDSEEVQVEPLTAENVPLALAKILARHDVVAQSLIRHPTRAGVTDIEDSIRRFTLHSGPADVPAYHDFHHLQLAFNHVWQELFSSDFVHTAKHAIGTLVSLGIELDTVLDKQANSTVKHKLKFKPGLFKDPESIPPLGVVKAFEITAVEWREIERLGFGADLDSLATLVNNGPDVVEFEGGKFKTLDDIVDALRKYREAVQAAKDAHRDARQQGVNLIRYARLSAFERPRFQSFHEILEDLEKASAEPHRFIVFGADGYERAINFGLASTYRQVWTPVSYQVGELLQSIPLAPKEVRRFSRKMVIKKSRAEKETEEHLRAVSRESQETARADSEIVTKARQSTNYQMSAEGGINVGIVNASASTAFSRTAEQMSQETKRQFREAVQKAAEEYKAERKLEINVTSESESIEEDSGEISNPNDEITVTYLFYELQRRYRVEESLHKLQPVVLVAQEVPEPAAIDDGWLIAHDWILRRVLLDDSFRPALDYLATRVVGDEVALQELFQNVEQQRKIADELKEELMGLRDEEDRRYSALQRSIRRRANAVDEAESDGFIENVGEFFAGSDSPTPEKMQIIEDAARDAYERARRLAKDRVEKLSQEISSLNALTKDYTESLGDHLNRRAQISRLRIHVKENILHYMQAIWSHEPPDQRMMRLKDIQVPTLTGSLSYEVSEDPSATPVPPEWKKPEKIEASCQLDDVNDTEPLSQVADIDQMLGFKGNYMMFPLHQSNVLTNFMMTPYLDGASGLRDPDPLATWTKEDFADYVCCLKHNLSDEDFDALRSGLREAYLRVANKGEQEHEIVVPTDSVYIEALPGAQPVLEDYKLLHRALDVQTVLDQTRSAGLENIRRAARILGADLEDPDIEKKVVIEGSEDISFPIDDD